MPTPNIALTSLAAAQSQKHITVNEAFARIDAAIHLSVKTRTQTAPPTAPEDGDRYLVAAPATGAWATHENSIAAWDQSALVWHILTPKAGWRIWVEAESLTLIHNGTEWTSFAGSQLGVNTSADATNRLAVASDALLLTHDGSGIQTKLNKATEADTASLLFQSNYSGHAEIGLTGDNDLHVKTSADGSTFAEAMVVDAGTGRASFPSGADAKGLALGPELAPNCLPDSGRFGGEDKNSTITIPASVLPGYLVSYNGSTLAPHARFIHNNTTHGGTAGALDPEIDALNALIHDAASLRYGIEWWALKLTQGPSTVAGRVLNGVTRYPAIFGTASPTPRAFTVGYYARVLSGSAWIDQSLTSRFARWGSDETGNLAAGVIVPSDGWVFIERQMTFNGFGYNHGAFQIDLESEGDELLFAMPRLVFGHVKLDPYLPGPLPNARFYG